MAESGLSGIVQGPAIDWSPIQRFGEQLVQARERQRASDEASIQTAIQIAQYDPALAEQIGGKAMSRLYKDKGLGRSGDFFKAIGTEAESKRSQQTQLFQQQMLQSRADIARSAAETTRAGAETTRIGVETKRLEAQQKDQENFDAAVGRLSKQDYPAGPEGEAKKVADATLARIHGLDADTVGYLKMTPEQRKHSDQMLQDTRDMGYAAAKLQLMGSIFVNGKPVTAEQADQLIKNGGQPLPGMTNIEYEKFKLEQRNVEIAARNAASEASLRAAQATDLKSQAKQRDAQAELYKLQVAYAESPEGKKMAYLQGLLEKAEGLKKAGIKIPADQEKAITNAMAVLGLGGTPEMQSEWLGLFHTQGYRLPTPEEFAARFGVTNQYLKAPGAKKPDTSQPDVGPTPRPAGQDFGPLGNLYGDIAGAMPRTGATATADVVGGATSVTAAFANLVRKIRGGTPLTDEERKMYQNYLQQMLHYGSGGIVPKP